MIQIKIMSEPIPTTSSASAFDSTTKATGKSGRFTIIGKYGASAIHSLALRIISLALDVLAVAIIIPTQIVSLKSICDPKFDKKTGLVHPKDADKIDTNKPNVLMIHGFLGTSNHMIYHRKSLADKGVKNLFTVDLGSPFHSVEEYAKVVHERVLEMQKITGRKDLIIVAHSMGGLVADAYKKLYAEEDGIKILDTITVGTPLAGTRIAYLAALFSKAARQMLPDSNFLKYRAMKTAPETYINERGNTENKQITINNDGIKITITTERFKDGSYLVTTEKENPKTKEKTIEKTTISPGKEETQLPFEKTLLEKKQDRTFHIGSTYDTVVPHDSSVATKSDEREGVVAETHTINIGGHGWQLLSPEVHELIHQRIKDAITSVQKAPDSSPEVNKTF